MDIYAEVTNRIIAELEKDCIPWRKPWRSLGAAVSHATGRPYSLLNQMLVGAPGEYYTFKQVVEAGGHVRKGEKAKIIVLWKWLDGKDEDGNEKKIPFLKYFNVFNSTQCEGLVNKYYKPNEKPADPDANAEQIIADYLSRETVTISHVEGNQAFYRPSTDQIVLPMMSQFSETAEYYSTAFHEMVHSTGHASRLNRLSDDSRFGNEVYSKEELIAEIGSAALVFQAGLETESSFRNSTAYIRSWLKALKDDKRLIISAAGRADDATNYILHGKQTAEAAA